ncbi:hypothetical protein H0G86_011567 [Trichoderma simmonsii]|uniref:Uncharacterized protein n=1 Tax=Trichoderma simmonsii TaxID=1491479 RepID=A0A8G0LLS8_9HYPO|nr:hypothetical protein H0G86_011567 [Trichoderma simmonsii]
MRVFAQQQKQQEAINPAFSSLLPKETRFHQASASIRQAREKYGDIISSPTREGLRQASLVVTEACTLEGHVKHFQINRAGRIEKLASRRKRGGLVRPTGDFHTAVSLNQIRQQDQESQSKNNVKMMKAQLREGRRIVNLELSRLKKAYTAAITERRAVGLKRIPRKAWLDLTKQHEEFLILKVQNKEYAALINYKDDPFFFNTTGSRSQHTEEVIQRALTRPHILEQMSECSWGTETDGSIDIVMGPFQDDNDEDEDEEVIEEASQEASQEATQETTQEGTQETLPSLAGDVGSDDEFYSPPSSPTLPRSKSRYHDIQKILADYRQSRNQCL